MPEADRPRDFVFHAGDLFHGSKAFKDRQKYPLERRLQAFRDILSIPSQIHLPVVFGWTRKDHSPDRSKRLRRQDLAFEHAHALSLCVIGAERFMRKFAAPFELATLTVEDNTVKRGCHALARREAVSQSRCGPPVVKRLRNSLCPIATNNSCVP